MWTLAITTKRLGTGEGLRDIESRVDGVVVEAGLMAIQLLLIGKLRNALQEVGRMGRVTYFLGLRC